MDDDIVVELSREEYLAARERALSKLGLTWEELKDQARRHDFDNASAAHLWLIIGE